MDRRTVGGLSGYQLAAITGTAVVGSVTAAVSVLLIVRRRTRAMIARGQQEPKLESSSTAEATRQEATGPEIPRHFSEELLIPGLTHTGVEIVQEDESNGRSPEGV